jgi:glycosyltransferase involved in cell wall biosynthesis
MVTTPLVSVVMSVYNGERYICEAIQSILNQTFSEFEFIIINDGSIDGTGAILDRYERVDGRISVYQQEHCGLIASLNRGCRQARGKYIARMDADDISLALRLKRQVHYMERHPEIGVLGTWIEYIDENGMRGKDWRMPTVPGLIGWSLLFGTCIAHPSVLMRRDVIERLDFYHPEALYAEDYDLWTRVCIVSRIANIPEILLQRRLWHDSVCSRHSEVQEQNVVKIMHSKILLLLGSEVSCETIANLRRLVTESIIVDLQQVQSLATLVLRLYRAYLKVSPMNRAEVRGVARDAGSKLWRLGVWAKKMSFSKGFLILVGAVGLYTSGVLRGLSQRA